MDGVSISHMCVLSDDYPDDNRMTFVFVQQLVDAMVDDGVLISVVAPQSLTHSLLRGVRLLPKYQIYQTRQGNSYAVYRPYSVSFGNGNKSLYRLVKRFNQKQVNKCLNAISPSIVYGHFWHNAMMATEYASQKEIPLFVACGEGDNALDDWAARLSNEEKIRIRHLVNGVISVSTENKRKCLEYGLSTELNTIVLPNCVNDEVFHPLDGTAFRNKLGASKSDFVISFTGAFIDRKGYNRLAEAIEILDDDCIKVIFSGKPMNGYKKNIPHCKGTIHCGAVNHNELPIYLCASDVFVLPTLKEGCCNAIVEALACGIPVISSDRSFNDDILNENNSLRVDPMNVSEISMAIKRLKDDGELFRHLKQYTLEHSSNYSIVVRAKRVRKFIESNLSKV